MQPKGKKKNEKENILSQIEKIAIAAKSTKFSEEFRNVVMPETESVARMIGSSQIQALLFSLIFNLNFTKSSVDIKCLSDYMECTPIMVARYLKDLDELYKRKILRCESTPSRERRHRENALDQVSYFVNRKVLDALMNDQKFTKQSDEATDNYDLISKIIQPMNDRENEQITYEEMEIEVQAILYENRQLPFVRELKCFRLKLFDMLVLFKLFSEFLDGNETPDFIDLIRSVFQDFRRQLEVRREFIDGSNDLIQKDLVSLEDGMFRSDRNIILKDRALDLLLGNDKNAFMKKQEKKQSDVILSPEIKSKRLFFNNEEERQLSFLSNSLMPNNYKELKKRLRDSGMKTGFCALLHGMPGTGKTESVLQIARKTGRDIKMVVISEAKSMWFGQSEKLIKGIFDQYRRQVEKSEITPILLFNEADAILSSRKQIGNSPVDQTENAIQNILLQEMEDLEGIMIATTNLTQNLDKAFDRRFLYKIRFDRPDPMNRIKIWKDKIDGLTMVQRKEIAARYDLTVGQIDNISRKLVINEVLQGASDFNRLLEFCEEEQLDGTTRGRMGFMK